MTLLLACLQIGAFLVIALACVRPRVRGRAAALLLALGGASGVEAFLAGSTPRSLTITSSTAAYEELDIVRKAFEVDQATAPGFAWGLLCCGFALGWAAWAWRNRARGASGAFGAPLALAWTGVG